MGTVWKREAKDGKSRWLARVRKVGGQHICETFDTKAKAQAWVAKVESEINEGRHSFISDSKKYRMDQLIDRYIANELPKKPKSTAKQQAQLEWWKSKIGHLSLVNVTPAVIVKCRDELSSGITARGGKRSDSTVNRYLAVLSHLFSVAVREWQVLSDSPMRKVSKLKESRGRDRILTPEEMGRLLSICKQSENAYLYLIVKILFSTGARKSEILSLKWSDINLETGKAILRETKNGRTRPIHFSPEIVELLEQHSKIRRFDSHLLFPSSDPNKPINIRYSWEKALELSGIQGFRLHDCRHQAASMMAMGGSSDAELRSFLGHLSSSQTVRYAHYRESAMANNVNKMNDLIAKIEANNAG